MAKNLPANSGDRLRSLGWEDPLEKKMTTHYSILVWKSHGQKNLVRYSPEGQERVRND